MGVVDMGKSAEDSQRDASKGRSKAYRVPELVVEAK